MFSYRLLLSLSALSLHLSITEARLSGWSRSVDVPSEQYAEQAEGSLDVVAEISKLAKLPSDLQVAQQDLYLHDCFSQALPAACSALQAVGSEDERMRVAATMAVCELRQIGTIPHECIGSLATAAIPAVRYCVQALARSPQQFVLFLH